MDAPNGSARVADFYRDRSIFITGATGFMGKVLVEKLLRDCGDLDKLYLLVRTKKGVEPKQRRQDYINHMVFDRIREMCPERLQKIRTVKGDVTQEGLGLSENDVNEMVENVSIVFHCAANVSFNQRLKDAANMNTQGTFRVLTMAEKLTKLVAFVHCSTAYCQCDEAVLEERGYPPPHNPLLIVEMTNRMDDDFLEYITPKLLKTLPNTYAYTKALTEGLVSTFKDKFPIAIARPSIVTAALREPYPGWVEGTNGPTGIMVGAGRGVIRSMWCNPDYPADVIPVDIAINTIIAVAWERGTSKSPEILYTNVAAASENALTWGQSIEEGKRQFYKTPLSYSLWYPDGSIKTNYYYHMFCVIFFHYLPAYFIDGLLFLFGKKRFMVRVQKKVSMGLKVLQYYTTKRWEFKNDRSKRLYNAMTKEDQETFFFDCTNVNWHDYISAYIVGTRTYLLQEPISNLPEARKNLRRLYIIDRIVTFAFYGLLLWLIYSCFGALLDSIQFVFEESRNFVSKRSIRI